MKNFLLAICILIPVISFSQTVFKSNGYSISSINDDFPDELEKENTTFVLDKNTIRINDFTYKIEEVLKDKSFWNNSIIVSVTLKMQSWRKLTPDEINNMYDVLETFEVGYDFSDKIKYIVTQRVKNGSMDYSSRFTKYVIGSNFRKEAASPAVNW